MSGQFVRPGGPPPHECVMPKIDPTIRHGAVWRCECGRRWRPEIYADARYVSSWERVYLAGRFARPSFLAIVLFAYAIAIAVAVGGTILVTYFTYFAS